MKCKQCSKDTKNKKFCSRSCSAKWNNANPSQLVLDNRRKLIKKCALCDQLIPNRHKFCKKCYEKRAWNTRSESKYLNELENSGFRKCPKCHQIKELSFFYKKANGKRPSYCKECNTEYAAQKLRIAKQFYVNYKGGKCEKCGYDKCIGALDFHHVDPTEKDFNISKIKHKSLKSINKPEILQELDKCILLCANCHREEHYNEKSPPRT